MTANDIPALYARCIARDDKGEYADIAAREALADAAGALCGLTWQQGLYPIHNTEGQYQAGVWESKPNVSRRLWDFYGRFAPLVSLDAASVPMPEEFEIAYAFIGGVTIPVERFVYPMVISGEPRTASWIHCHGRHNTVVMFPYTHPTARPVAECAARVYANLRAKEVV